MEKKICLMSGAFLNAGDFLIEKRSLELIRHFLPDSEVNVHKRLKEDYTYRIDMLKDYDAIIFAGGPLYQSSIYPVSIPFVRKEILRGVFLPIFFVGGGIKGDIYNQPFSKDTKWFFEQGVMHHVPLGCRDYLTYRFLKHQGFKDVIMTGCPAWYNLEYVNQIRFTHFSGTIKKICISEPANKKNVPVLRELLLFLRKKYQNAEIVLVNHRETKREVQEVIKELIDRVGFSFIDISGSAEGFAVYDDCDMHVGFRVHAHIYNLSIRNFSILINEDIRGRGVSHALGLENIDIERPSYREKRLFGDFYLTKYNNCSDMGSAVVKHIDDFIEMTESMNYDNYKDAFRRMTCYFNSMAEHFNLIKKYFTRGKLC